ncbi:hypothetical protein ACFQ0O_13860 [Saccharopolyspora spinosporotrichia]
MAPTIADLLAQPSSSWKSSPVADIWTGTCAGRTSASCAIRRPGCGVVSWC